MQYCEIDYSQLTDVIYICTCVCCNEKTFDEGKGIATSDGFSVCSTECLKLWEGDNFPNHPAAKQANKNRCVFCNGKGKIAHYHHIDNGKCYHCNGTGKNKRV